MAFHQTMVWKEIGLQMQEVKDKCNAIIKHLNLPREDARVLGVVHIRQFCNTLVAVPLQLQHNAENRNNIPVIMRMPGLRRMEDLRSCLGDLNKNSKISFVTMAQFAFENCIGKVLEAIPNEKKLGSFSRSSKRIIDVARLKDAKNKHDLIMVPAWIRNTLHAGGIHEQADKTVVVDGEPFVFQKGQRFECATWSHVLYVFLHCLDVYEEILISKKVKEITFIKTA